MTKNNPNTARRPSPTPQRAASGPSDKSPSRHGSDGPRLYTEVTADAPNSGLKPVGSFFGAVLEPLALVLERARPK